MLHTYRMWQKFYSIPTLCIDLKLWWLNVVAQWGGMWWLNAGGCGGSVGVHQTVKPAVPGSNPASLQPALQS